MALRNSLARKSGELGDSDGESRRMEIDGRERDDVSWKRCGRGLKAVDGIECDSVGASGVGGSYLLQLSKGRCEIRSYATRQNG